MWRIFSIVTHQSIARQQLCKQSNTHAVNNTVEVFSIWSAPQEYTSIARKRLGKHSFSTVHLKRCFLCGPCRAYIRNRGDSSGIRPMCAFTFRTAFSSQWLGIYLGHPDPRGYKYRNLALQVGEISNLRQ
jgi:hypothetical protein